jgi:hypothetical protein
MGKHTFLWPFSIAMLVYQRVSMAITVAPDPQDFGTERNGKCRP